MGSHSAGSSATGPTEVVSCGFHFNTVDRVIEREVAGMLWEAIEQYRTVIIDKFVPGQRSTMMIFVLREPRYVWPFVKAMSRHKGVVSAPIPGRGDMEMRPQRLYATVKETAEEAAKTTGMKRAVKAFHDVTGSLRQGLELITLYPKRERAGQIAFLDVTTNMEFVVASVEGGDKDVEAYAAALASLRKPS